MTSSFHYFYVFYAWQENLNNQINPITLTRTWKIVLNYIYKNAANFSWPSWFLCFLCVYLCLCISDPAREFFAWLETALSHNCVPPNVELTPDAIRNGEVLLTNVSHTASITYPHFPTRSIHRHWLACNTS